MHCDEDNNVMIPQENHENQAFIMSVHVLFQLFAMSNVTSEVSQQHASSPPS